MLTVIGDLIADLIVLGGHTLVRGTDNPAEVRLTRGGSAANVAVAAAGLHPARFIGRVGADALGDALVGQLTLAGVDVRVQRGGRTGAIVVLVDDEGERTMITDRGAAADLSAIDSAWLDGSDRVHVPLYGFADAAARRAILDVLTGARRSEVPVSLDLSSTDAMRSLGETVLADLLERVMPDVVFANADEAGLAAQMSLDPPGVYVVKRGAEPVSVRVAGAWHRVAVQPVEVVDSTGAGDAFAAGYLSASIAGADPLRAAHAGADLAPTVLTRPGAL